MRIAVFDNLANSAYIVTKALRQLGHDADLVLDPVDRHVMSDPRWEDLELELPTGRLADAAALPDHPLPDWVLAKPIPRRRGAHMARLAAAAPGAAMRLRWAARAAGSRGALLVLDRAWVVRTLRRYDCVIAYGMGPAWAAIADVPCVAMTWGGDITMVPFYDTGDWEGHETLQLPGPRRELSALAKLQRLGYSRSGRIVLTDPRFIPFAERLGHTAKTVRMGFFIDTEKYAPGAEPELRRQLLNGRDGLIVFMPSRQDWFWKGSDRLLHGFARATAGRDDIVLVCAGWGADLERSERLMAELDIRARVRLLPYAMSKARLRRYYRAADIVADQFMVGSYGGSALEAMSCARPVLIHLEPARFEGGGALFPPVVNVGEPEAIGAALGTLLSDHEERRRVGERARDWVAANHGPWVINRTLQLCRTVMEGG